MFGRRRQQREREEEAAREAERRALFEELAKRPDTICPFLGLADARAEYRDRVSEAHRCYAFGDPAELSAEQQQKVCLQRGYGNCPRYLRGVLVIPTEELEALRRPQPAPPPTPLAPRRPAPAPAPARAASPGRGRRLVMAIGILLLVATLGGAGYLYLRSQVPSSAISTTLPAGTDIGAELLSLSAPGEDGQELRATAFIGETEAVPNTSLVYVFDLSGSVLRGAGCGGEGNGDGLEDTPLDCAIAAATALNEQAEANGTVAEVGLVGFAAGAVSADLAQESGAQDLVAPGLDDDDDGTPNVVEAMRSAFTGPRGSPVGFRANTAVEATSGSTAFSAGIAAACQVLEGTTTPNRLVVFLSDGGNRGGEAVSTVLPCATAAVFQTFAAGPDASCEEANELGNMQQVADLTQGSCTPVIDLAELPVILGAVVAPQLVRIDLTIDGGEPIDISPAADPPLPRPGPGDVEIEHLIPALAEGDHRLCMTVHGSDAGGPGSTTTCSDVSADGGRLTDSD